MEFIGLADTAKKCPTTAVLVCWLHVATQAAPRGLLSVLGNSMLLPDTVVGFTCLKAVDYFFWMHILDSKGAVAIFTLKLAAYVSV